MNMQCKKSIKTILIILCMVVLLTAVGCNRQEVGGQSPGIFFREDSVTVEKYETYALELQGAEGKQVEWKTQDESVATVQDGVVCGWKKGNTQILASVDGVETACNVIITDNQYIPVLKLRETDELALDLGGTYTLKPVLHYNAKEYTDVEYTYSCVGSAVTVDENGVIKANEAGEALVSVQGKWRSNVVEASLTVYVIDVSTSVEVSGKAFDIYLNSYDKEFPSSADLGISIFDKDTPIQEEDTSIKYIELLMEGDVEGAAAVENGVVYAKKIGTTHFVAEYTPSTGEAVRTTVFTVNVHKSPADIYMTPIAGEEYESFITPMNPINSVKWDESLGAFHLTNLNAAEDDGRAFLFSRDYIEKILQYTNAKSIVFEVKSDGISSGSPAPNEVIYQGFYPEWYDPENYLQIDNCGEWTKVEIFFDKIPLDSDGNRKSIMLLSTKEGMYIRNIRPMTEGSFLTMDLEMTTLGGNWTKDIEIGLYPHSYKGSINDYNKRVTIKAGVKTTVKVRLDDFLEGGRVPGFGLVVYGGPAWDAKLPDGQTPDRHTLKISNLRVSGETNYSLDLSTADWTSGKDGTGFTDANGSGIPSYDEGVITITNGFLYDGHKFTLDSEAAKNRTYLCLDMQIDTLGGDWAGDIEMRFYPHNFEGNPHEAFGDKVAVKAGKQVSVKLNAADYLIDGKLTGIGIGIFGGPTWDATLPDGYTPDRHTVTVTGVRLEGARSENIDLRYSEFTSGTIDTGYTVANGAGQASVVNGAIVISNGFCYDCHKITFGSEESQEGTYVCLDMQIDTLGGDWVNDIEMRFYSYNFAGNPHEVYTNKIVFKAGEQITVRLKADNYLVDGKLNGIGIGIFGGPTWDAKLPDGNTPDRHTVTISGVRLEGETSETYDLSKSVCISGTGDTGYTVANGSGKASFTDGVLKITDGFCYDCHKISFAQETEPGETEPDETEPDETEPDETEPGETEPGTEEQDTYVVLDVQIDTLGGNWNKDIEVRFYSYNFAGNPHEVYTDSVIFKAGEQTTVQLNADAYLVDGKLNGIGIGIFGGPTWDAKLPDGYTPDRHTVTISNVHLAGGQSTTYDLSKSVCISGTGDTGYTVANGSGVAAFTDGALKITNGFCYDCHKISLTEETDPGTEEQKSYVVLDMQMDTLGGNWNKDIEMRFYAYNFEGNPHEVYTDKVIFKAGEKQTVKLDAEKYLVEGKLTGIGIGIFGGPTWDAKLPDGYTPDRHTVTISGVKLEGVEPKTYDLSKSVCISGTGDTGYTVANGSGVAAFTDGVLKITNGFCYDCHKISLVEDAGSYLAVDMQIDTLGGNWNKDIEMRFYAYNFEGNPHEVYTDKVIFKAGEKQTVKLDAEKYLVEGKLTGIGIGIFGGPTWDAKLPDGYTPDRHTVTISGVKLEGVEPKTYDLSKSVCISGTGDTGYTVANGSGVAAFTDGALKITNGFCYDCHKISLTEESEPGAEEQETYIVMDLLLTTLGNSTNPVEMRFCIYNQEDTVHTTYTDRLNITPGTETTVRLNVDQYLVDGELPGFGIAIFGGPEWNTQLSNGTYDRHSVVISDLRLEGAGAKTIDLNAATVSTGIPGSNTGGQIAIADGQIVISGGFRYDGHLITFGAEDRKLITRQLHALPAKKESYLKQDSLSDSTAP